ncbi:hypothetical protein M434DRAFT_272960 [Hypoxylon sp. CO27-5]|nr:hypothetical protein M434DRAFT_272960 [Hypoxylon sp. CO27-5]
MQASRDLPRDSLSPTSETRGIWIITLSSPSITFYFLHPLFFQHRTKILSRALDISVCLSNIHFVYDTQNTY